MEQEGSLIHITNTGNVDYNDEITIILESDGEKYLINKKLKLVAFREYYNRPFKRSAARNL